MPKKRSRKKQSTGASDDSHGEDEVMFWFGNHLMSYFGDNEYDDQIVDELRALFPDYPFVEQNFRLGLKIAIDLSDEDCILLVQHFANRRAETAEAARAWLENLRDKLFAPESPSETVMD
jgi:hypothetical protein